MRTPTSVEAMTACLSICPRAVQKPGEKGAFLAKDLDDGQTITRELVQVTLSKVKYQPHRMMKIDRVSFGPQTSILTVLRTTFPKISDIMPYLFNLRQYGDSILRITLDNAPF
jgi:hypothetical protein